MFKQLIGIYHKKYKALSCCRDRSICNCSSCLYEGFRSKPDQYICEKRMHCYVLKYGSSYISEFYYYLETSKLLERFNKQKTIKILSLGCGFSPDYYAINKYIKDNNLPIFFNYCGLDNSSAWNGVRQTFPNVKYHSFDLKNKFSLKNFNIVVLCKVFSTLYRNNSDLSKLFIENLSESITNSMDTGAILVFNDINSNGMGRDMFDTNIKTLFINGKIKRYYTDSPKYKESSWCPIEGSELLYSPINDITIDPLYEIRQNIFFEYEK